MTCTHDAAPFRSRSEGKHPATRMPIPDETVRCPDCLEKVKFHAGRVITVREGNALLAEEHETFREAQRCLREGDRDGLMALLDRSRPFRAAEAARQAREPYDPSCRVIDCDRPKVRGITVCLTHEREWDRLPADQRGGDDASARSAAWHRFLRGEST